MSSPGTKVLIIADDDQDDQILLKEATNDMLFPPSIHIVSDGNQLMKQLKSGFMPDLILLDLNMPNKNGIECLIEIRQDLGLNHLPVVVLSTSKDHRDIELSFNNGANLFFSKPCTFESLKSMVHATLNIEWSQFSKNIDKSEFFRIANEGLNINTAVEN